MAVAVVGVLGLVALWLGPSGRGRESAQSPSSRPTVERPRAASILQHRIVRTYPHDRTAFTQGLIYRDGFLYESTGLYGQSSLRKVALDTGDVVREMPVEKQYFAEGLTEWGASLIQLTWRSGLAFVYDRETLKRTGQLTYEGEGWGLTHTDRHLVMSDGSASIRLLDPATFNETARVQVSDENGPVTALNELEMVRGVLFANVWRTDRIALISLESGAVTGWLDLRGVLTPAERRQVDVMNGIAYDEAGDRLFITGKYWPKVFHIEVIR